MPPPAQRSQRAEPTPGDRAALGGGLLLAVALVGGCVLMAPMAWAGPLVLDEHGSYWIIDSQLPGSSLRRSLDYAAIPPLSGWLQQGFLNLLGKGEFVFRLPSALCYLGAILLTYLAGTALCDRGAGGLAALVLAWHPEALDEVRIARCYGLVLMLSAALLWATARWMQQRGSLAWALAWALTAAGLLWTHYTAAPLIGMIWLTLVLSRSPDRSGRRPPVWNVALATAILGGLSLPLLPAVARLWEWSPFLNYLPDPQPLWTIIGPFWWLGFPVGVLVAWLLTIGTKRDAAAPRKAMPLLAVWTLLPLFALAIFATLQITSLANPRYRVPYAAGGACLVAMGLRGFRLSAASVGAIALVAAAWTASGSVPWQLGRLSDPAAEEWRAVAEHIDRYGRHGEPLFAQSGLIESNLVAAFRDDPLFMEYVVCRVGRFYLESFHPRYGLPFVWDARTGLHEYYRDVLVPRAGKPVPSFWIACATDTDLNRNSLQGMAQIADGTGYTRQNERRFKHTTLLRYERPPTDHE